jgi:hypothetical protein
VVGAGVILVNAVVAGGNRSVGQAGVVAGVIIDFGRTKDGVFAGADFEEKGLGQVGIRQGVGRPQAVHLGPGSMKVFGLDGRDLTGEIVTSEDLC